VIHGILLSTNDGDALDGLSQDELEWNLGMSMLAFLKHARSNNPAVANELVQFTQTFGGVHASKTIDTLILECEKSVNAIKMFGNTKGAKATEAGWGIAMTKNALMAYIDWIGAKATEIPHNGVWTKENLSNFKKCVCGVGDTAERGNGFHGLRHWVYINEAGYMYNWATKTLMNKSPARPYERSNHNYLVHVLQLN
jgi:hypothetical protein